MVRAPNSCSDCPRLILALIIGDVVRYGPNRLVFNTEPALKGIYGHGANVLKSKGYEKVSLLPGVHSSIATLDNTKHKGFRRLLTQGLSDANIRSMDSKMTKIAASFARIVGEKQDRHVIATGKQPALEAEEGWSVPKNMAHWCDYFTFDMMSELVFGSSYDLLQDSQNHFIIDGITAQMHRFGFLLNFPGLESMGMNHILFPSARGKALRFYAKSKQIMEERKARKGERKDDVLSNLLAATDPETGESFSNQQLWIESNLLIIAGSDTSSTAMAALFFYLCRNPAAYDRVTKEVRGVFQRADEISQGPKLSSCSYLRACIQEALRLCPPVTGPLWRQVLSGGLTISGHNIPAGSGTGFWSLNRSEKYYTAPLEFRPERWISESTGADQLGLARAAFASFSVGPRNCVGKGLAITELMLGMAAVISQYDFRPARDTRLARVGEGEGASKGQFQTFWGFTSAKDGPYIEYRAVR
ncbi:cytochrome P450 [Aspergillus pseudodeflectus]|uniref:Cytochrome P450 n=1 Tax=Aspergillus pseudodeflectus TaxID=176178 RepID=A0ABR4KB68_9EURO